MRLIARSRFSVTTLSGCTGGVPGWGASCDRCSVSNSPTMVSKCVKVCKRDTLVNGFPAASDKSGICR